MFSPSNIIVRSPNWIGDHVMALPFYGQLRASYPNARLTLLCTDNVAELSFSEIFDGQIILPNSKRRTLPQLSSFSKELKPKQFDLALSLPSSTSSALLLFLAGIPNRVGFSEHRSSLFLTLSRKWPGAEARKHKSELYLELLELLTSEKPGLTCERAASFPGKKENLIVVAPGAANPLRVWPYFQELLEQLRIMCPEFRVCVVGSESTESKWHAFLRRMDDGGIEDCIGKTTLTELISLCRRASLVIANDSGVSHLAARLANASTLVLFGPGAPSYVKPFGQEVIVARLSTLACSPCEKSDCRAPYGYQRCLRDLSLEQVLSQVIEKLPRRTYNAAQ